MQKSPNSPRQYPLRLVLIVPFVLQILVAVGLVDYLSWKNGQKAVNNLATQLQGEIASRIKEHINNYLAIPHQIDRINTNLLKMWKTLIPPNPPLKGGLKNLGYCHNFIKMV